MTGRSRAARHCAVLMLGAVVGLTWGCRMRQPPAAAAARVWASGPVQWLLLSDERRQIQRVSSTAELNAFIEEFWARRSCGGEGGEELAAAFASRVSAADRLYTEGELRGGLTDRGRALILLGPPSVLRHSQRRVPVATSARGPVRPTRTLPQEDWAYSADELPAALATSLGLRDGEEVTLVFLVERRRTVLVQGERILQQAARALARSAEEGGPDCLRAVEGVARPGRQVSPGSLPGGPAFLP